MLNEPKLRRGQLLDRLGLLLHWLSWLSRDRMILLVATLALGLGVIQPWYKLPPETLAAFGASLSIANAGRILAALCVCLSIFLLYRPNSSRMLRLGYWWGFMLTLLFPYFITTWVPTIDYISSSMYMQRERITPHVKMNSNQIQAQWKQNVQLTPSFPITTAFDLSVSNARFFQLSSWNRVWLNGFGYSRSFLAFIGRGWMMSGLGFGIGLLGIYLGLSTEAFPSFLKDMSKLLPGVAIIFGILVCSFFFPSFVNYELDAIFARGEYHQVLSISRVLSSLYWPIRSDEGFMKRIAEASFYGDEPNESLINFAKGLERYRFKDLGQAETFFQRSLDLEPQNSVVRGYLATTILNQAVNYYNTSYSSNAPNTRKPGAALDRFERVLQVFPNHLEAMYDLMLASTVNGEFERSAKVAKDIIEVERYAQLPNLSLLGQAYLHSTWTTFKDGDPNLAWRKFRQSTDTQTWNQTFEEGGE